MSSRLTRRATQAAVWARRYHHLSVGGPPRPGALRMRRFHNAVAVRHASFARLLPKLLVKFVRIPALFGGVMIGGAAWVQYQAIR
jgi:dynamin-like GTPase MGM1, mitochondrial